MARQKLTVPTGEHHNLVQSKTIAPTEHWNISFII
jgi:hypothetical protein